MGPCVVVLRHPSSLSLLPPSQNSSSSFNINDLSHYNTTICTKEKYNLRVGGIGLTDGWNDGMDVMGSSMADR